MSSKFQFTNIRNDRNLTDANIVKLNVSGLSSLNGGANVGSNIVSNYQDSIQTVANSENTIISADNYFTTIDSTEGFLYTLENGTQYGQLKKLLMTIVNATFATIVSFTGTNGNRIQFNNVGEYAILLWNGTAWRAIELAGVGIDAPIVFTVIPP